MSQEQPQKGDVLAFATRIEHLMQRLRDARNRLSGMADGLYAPEPPPSNTHTERATPSGHIAAVNFDLDNLEEEITALENTVSRFQPLV